MKALLAYTMGLGLWAETHRAIAQGFVRHFDGEQAGKPGAILSVREAPSGFLLFCSQVSSDGTNRTHLFTRVIDVAGMQLEEQEFYFGVPCHFTTGRLDPVATSPDGSYLAPIMDGCDGLDQGVVAFSFDGNGDTLSTDTVLYFWEPDSSWVIINHARRCADGGHFFGGNLSDVSTSGSLERAYLIRTQANGDTLWTRIYSPNPNFGYTAVGVAEYPDGGAIMIGSRGGGGVNKTWIMRVNAQGGTAWIRYMGNLGAPYDCAVRLDGNGGIITYSAYREPSFPTLYGQFMLTKWNAGGDISWQKKSHYGRNYYVGDFEVLPDNSIIAVGSHDGGGELMRFSAEGDSLWTRQYVAFQSSERHRLFDVQPTSDGGFVAAGSCDQYWGDPTPNLETEWMIKTDSMGCVVPGCQYVGVQEVVVDLQEHLRIAPNPVQDVLKAELDLPAGTTLQGAVRAVLLNAHGQQVKAWPMRRSGDQLSLNEEVSALPHGMYYLHLADEKRWLAGGKVVVQ